MICQVYNVFEELCWEIGPALKMATGGLPPCLEIPDSPRHSSVFSYGFPLAYGIVREIPLRTEKKSCLKIDVVKTYKALVPAFFFWQNLNVRCIHFAEEQMMT